MLLWLSLLPLARSPLPSDLDAAAAVGDGDESLPQVYVSLAAAVIAGFHDGDEH